MIFSVETVVLSSVSAIENEKKLFMPTALKTATCRAVRLRLIICADRSSLLGWKKSVAEYNWTCQISPSPEKQP